MAAKIITVSSADCIWAPEKISRLWFFPDGSEFLKYSPHWHLIHESGFRTNVPLCGWVPRTFVIVEEGKFSVKDYYGITRHKIFVRDQVWYDRSVAGARATNWYKMMVRGVIQDGAQLPRSLSRS